MYGLHCVFDGVFHIGMSEPQRLPGTRKLQKRVDQVGHLIHCDANFLIEFLALLGGQPALTEELGIGDDRGQGMPEIMRNRARHTANGGEPLRFQQLLLGFQQTVAHALEGPSDLGNFVTSPGVQRISEIATFQSAYPGNQTSEWPGEGVRDEKHEGAPS